MTITSQQSNVVFINIPRVFKKFLTANLLKQFINHTFNFLGIEKSDIIKSTYPVIMLTIYHLYTSIISLGRWCSTAIMRQPYLWQPQLGS
jgi:hypothetical protein